MSPAFFKFFGHLYIVIKGVFVSLRIKDVAGIAHGGFEDLILLKYLIHGYFHVGDPVQ